MFLEVKQNLIYSNPLLCNTKSRNCHPVNVHHSVRNCLHTLLKFDPAPACREYILLPNTKLIVLAAFIDDKNVLSSLYGITTQPRKISLPAHSALYYLQIPFPTALKILQPHQCVNLLDSESSLDNYLNDNGVLNIPLKRQFIDDAARELEIRFFRQGIVPAYAQLPTLNEIFTEINKFAYDITVSQIAAAIGYSERQTYQIFKSNIGLGIKAYCCIAKFEAAISELTSYKKNIMEIGHSLGYYDQAYFTHEFKRLSKMTPIEYQSQYFPFFS